MPTILNSMGAIVLGSTAFPATNLSYNGNVSGQQFRHDDREFNSIQATTGSAPTVNFQCPVSVALPNIGLRVTKLTAFSFYLAEYTDGVHGATATKYALAVGATAYAVIDGFSAGQGGIVLANVTVGILSSDGVTNPLVKSTEAIPAITEPLLHTLGPVIFNGTAIDGVQGCEFSLSQRWQPFSADGDIYPQVGSYDGGDPSITVNHGDPVSVLGNNYLGEPISATTSFTLLAIAPLTQVPSVTDQIVVTVADGRIMPQGINAAVGSIATGGWQVISLSSAAHVHPWAIS